MQINPKKALKYGVTGALLYVGLTTGVLGVLGRCARSGSPEIPYSGDFRKDTQTLQRVIDEQKPNFGLENASIKAYVEFENPLPNKTKLHSIASTGHYQTRSGEKGLVIFVHSPRGMNVASVRHELRHIKNGDLEGTKTRLIDYITYFLYKEPRVALQDIIDSEPHPER